ncbi:MAG TPA: hypothetical protein VGO66_09545 [Solirubrobacterales bacterium]|nr:hypothetical protein [Solirubrobacterales bacterium]
MVRRLVIAVMAVMGVLAVPVAQADTGDIIDKQNVPHTAADGFQAGTCIVEPCSPETAAQFYKTAAGHPPFGFTQYIVKQEEFEAGKFRPVGSVGTIRVDLPPGLTVNPEATTVRCTLAEFETPKPADPFEPPNCPAAAQVGEELLTLKVIATGGEVPPTPNVTKVPLYNLVPAEGEPAMFGFKLGAPGAKKSVFLKTEVAWESDYHESFTIALPTPNPGTLSWKSRLVNVGTSGDGTYITNPTTCIPTTEAPFQKNYSTFLRARPATQVAPTFPAGFTPFEAPLPLGVELEGCAAIPFDPTLEVDPGTTQVDSPAPATVTTKLPFIKGGATISESHLRNAKVTLPAGMGLNPSGSVGLVACTDAQFAKGQRVENNTCPAASIVGTAEVDTPPLPDGSLKGDVYVGEQKSMNPTSGEEFRVLVEAKSKRYGIVARLVGNVIANPTTGQLTAVFDEQEVGPLVGPMPKGLPQVPFESVKLKFDGAKATLSSPPTCAAAETTSVMEPWSTPISTKTPSAKFTLSGVPGGGTCPQTLAERKFVPGYTAKSDSTKAGAYSPFRVHIGRPDGEQELKGVNVTLPKGLTGKLAGVPYCSEAALTAAAASTGVAQQTSSSCSSASQIGTASTEAGTGAVPAKLAGKAFLAGPYKGAPLSMAVITPAVSGPYDLGTVVVRVALNVNPKTAQVNAVSDVIPDVFGGVKLDLRSVDVNVDRSKFMRNPTNCAAQATSGVLNGGSADPTNPASFSSYAVSAAYQASQCGKLNFKPKLFTRLYGGTKRDQNPRLRAILEAREGDANVSRTALTLPHSLFLDQSHIRTVCTRVQLAAKDCPKAAIYGHAKAKSPLLDKKLKGPVYLVSSDNLLPDLVADLRGQVNIQLHGVISSKRGGLKTVFDSVPDVPVKKFILTMEKGSKSLLVNSRNLCGGPQASVLNIKAQNGKKVKNNQLPLKVSACGKKKK